MPKKKVNPAADPSVPNQFELDGKKYNVVHGVIIHLQSGQAKLTPADICATAEAQAILVAGGSSALQEVID